MTEAAKKVTKKAAKKAAAPKPVKEPRVVQNSIGQPSKGTTSARIWEIADYYTTETGSPAVRGDVVGACVAEGLNSSTASTQYGRWRKFNGLKGTGTPPKAEAEAAPEAA